jgi:non-heme chloroperoxidase
MPRRRPAATGQDRPVTTLSVVGAARTRLCIEDIGNPDRPAVVLLHGIGSCRHVWERQVRSELASRLRLVTVDLRGHGGSDAPPDGYGDSRRWADDVRAVLDALSLHRPVLVGWSYSGAVICDYVATHSDAALGGVVLVGAVSDLGTPEALEGLGQGFLAVSRRLVRAEPADLPEVTAEFVDLLTARPLPPEERGQMRAYASVVPGYVFGGMLRRTLRHDATLRSVRVPTLVVHGAEDAVVLPSQARRVAGLVPGARLVTYPGVGHVPCWEAPDRFNADLFAFVDRAAAARHP